MIESEKATHQSDVSIVGAELQRFVEQLNHEQSERQQFRFLASTEL